MTSCIQKRFLYAPSPPNHPFLSKKGETKIAACLSNGPSKGVGSDSRYNRGYDLQGAYAISNNWAVTLNYTKRNERDTYKSKLGDAFYDYFDTATINYNRSLTEVGFGYFSSARDNDPVFSIYGGIGFGRFTINENGRNSSLDYTRYHNSNIIKFYLQPAISVNLVKNLDIAFVARFTAVNYNNIATSYTDDEKRHFKLQTIESVPVFFAEPSFIVQYQIPSCRWLKAEADLTTIVNPTAEINYRASNASVGLVFDFSKLTSPKK